MVLYCILQSCIFPLRGNSAGTHVGSGNQQGTIWNPPVTSWAIPCACSQVDVLRDEAEEFAAKLQAAGVKVKCKRYQGHFHNSMIDVDLFGDVEMNTFKEIKEFLDTVL